MPLASGAASSLSSWRSAPTVVKEVKPKYTPVAMQKKIQGSVWLEAVVTEKGNVGEVQVTRSLDAEYGLDQAAIGAAQPWKFQPAFRQGKPVSCMGPPFATVSLLLRC